MHAVVDKDGKREVKVIASGLHRPNGLAFKDGTLYVAEISKVSKIEKIEDNLDNPPKPAMIYDDLPKDEAHGWKFIGIGPDNKLYIPVGLPCNSCPRARHARADAPHQSRRQRRGSHRARHPQHGRLRLASGLEAALLHRQRPRLGVGGLSARTSSTASPRSASTSATRSATQGDFLDPELGWGRSCDEFVKPIAKMGPHTAALGMRFYTGKMFPAEYRDRIFVARRGSWNRTKKAGGDVVAVKLNKDGTVKIDHAVHDRLPRRTTTTWRVRWTCWS